MKILLLIGALMLVGGASATPEQPLDLSRHNGGGQWDYMVEKQSWWLDSGTVDPAHTVVNPTNCSWDINDHGDVWSRGSMAPGASVETTSCHIMDFNPMYSCRPMCAEWNSVSNWFGERVTSPKPPVLNVQVCYRPQGRCFTAVPVWDTSLNLYSYSFCGQAVYRPDDPAVVEIEGSNGGRGVLTDVVLTVRNTSSKTTLRGVRVQWGIASDGVFPSGCEARSNPSVEYPFRWIVGN